MLDKSQAYSVFSVDDLDKAKEFYREVLGLPVTEEKGGLTVHLGSGADVMVYLKKDHVPAVYTMLNFPVDDVEKAVDDLNDRGVEVERFPEWETDEKGIYRGEETDPFYIAWFRDPAGNIFSVLQEH